MSSRIRPQATLMLADGKAFFGRAIGAFDSRSRTTGEVVFNTSMTGYQEIITDPSYANQMITFTYPHIGNVGVNSEDMESRGVFATGIIVKELSRVSSNFRCESTLEEFMIKHDVLGISELDTRKLVVHLRECGAQMGIIATGEVDLHELAEQAKALPSMEGQDLVSAVSTDTAYPWTQGSWEPGKGYRTYQQNELAGRPLVVVIDCGVKYNILRLLIDSGVRVLVVPAKTSASDILALNPQGVFVSNGPGDPAVVDYVIGTVKELLGKLPIFGICLGHQILGLALNAPTYKLKFGHHAANHPVRHEATGKVEITAQNHGFASDRSKLPAGLEVSHVNLNDNTVSGFRVPELKAFSVQYHPESSPGPQDSRYLFNEFFELLGVSR